MKIEMSHEIKSTKQSATQPVNHTNRLQKKKLRNQPNNISVKQLTAETSQQPKVELTLHTNLPNDK